MALCSADLSGLHCGNILYTVDVLSPPGILLELRIPFYVPVTLSKQVVGQHWWLLEVLLSTAVEVLCAGSLKNCVLLLLFALPEAFWVRCAEPAKGSPCVEPGRGRGGGWCHSCTQF